MLKLPPGPSTVVQDDKYAIRTPPTPNLSPYTTLFRSNHDCSKQYYQTAYVTVNTLPFVDSISVSSEPFAPTGCSNAPLIITVRGPVGRQGLTSTIIQNFWPLGPVHQQQPLTEVSTGVY